MNHASLDLSPEYAADLMEAALAVADSESLPPGPELDKAVAEDHSGTLVKVNCLAWHFEQCDKERLECSQCTAWINILKIVSTPELSFSDPIFSALDIVAAGEG